VGRRGERALPRLVRDVRRAPWWRRGRRGGPPGGVPAPGDAASPGDGSTGGPARAASQLTRRHRRGDLTSSLGGFCDVLGSNPRDSAGVVLAPLVGPGGGKCGNK